MKKPALVLPACSRQRLHSSGAVTARRILHLERLEERCVPATLTVMNLNDSGTGSFRQAIQQANSDGPTDTIVFNSGLTGTLTLSTGELSITQPMIIQGPGASMLTINGNNTSRIFNANGASNVTLSGLTLTNANAGANPGGALFDPSGTLTLTNVVLTANKATSRGGALFVGTGGALTLQSSTLTGNMALGAAGNGGAVYVAGNGSAVVQDSILSGNVAGLNGGGLYLFNGGNLTVQRSTLSGNSSANVSGTGGGLDFAGSGTLLIQNSTLSGNSVTGANSSGGGLFLNAFTGSATIQNSTFSANAAADFGGGIRFQSGSGALTIENSTLTKNIADADNNGTGSGGGLSRDPAVTGTVQVISTVVAGNTDNSAAAPDLGGTVVASFSLVQNTTGALLGTLPTNITGQDPQLGPLQHNGGPTQTHALPLGSPALNKGFNVAGLTTDQRGASFARSIGDSTDIGAFQVVRSAPSFNQIMVTNLNDAGAGSLRQAVLTANGDMTADQIVFTSGLTGTITLTTDEIPITRSVVIQGPGASQLTINGNNTSRIFDITGVLNVSISGLTLTNGNASNSSPPVGGAILDRNGSLTLTNVVLSGNKVAGRGGAVFVGVGAALTLQSSTLTGNRTVGVANSDGGAVSVDLNGSVVLQDSTVTGNMAVLSGGGLYLFNGGNLTVQRSTLSGNSSANVNGGGGGLAISGSGTLSIQNSTISGNSVEVNGSGGGLFLATFTGSATIQNSTFSDNLSTDFGGGIRFQSGSGALTIENSTITGNVAEQDSDGPGTGGGLSVDPAVTGITQLISTLVAGNVDRVPGAPDLGGTVVASFSLVQNTTGAMLGTLPTNITGQDPQLITLLNNGGPTQTHALPLGSPALNKGFNVAGLANDQRGDPYPRTRGSTTDIGAFELFISSGAPTATFVPVTTPRTTPVGLVTVNFSAPVVGVTLSAFSLTRDGTTVPLTGLTVTRVTPSQYNINLSSVTAMPGSYVFTLTAAGSGIQDLGGISLAGNASLAFQVTTANAPRATIVPVTTPRTTPAGVVTINFSTAVTGVTITPFGLTRNGTTVPLTGLTVTRVTPSQYTIDLTSVTATPGNYVFTLTATGSGIKDASNNPLAADASISFRVTTPTGPTATIVPVTTPRTTPAGVVTINFSTAVTGVTITPFGLTRNGTTVPLTGLSVTQVTPSQYTIDLTNVTAMMGNYVFTLTAAGSGIKDASNNPLAADASISFQVTTSTVLHSVYEPGVYDPVSSTFYVRDEKNSGAPDSGTFIYGLQNWKPVTGDFTGSKKTTISIVDPSGFRDTVNHRDAYWFLGSANGVNDIPAFAYGFAAWTPISGDWTGSGKFGIGVYDPTTAMFYLRNETNGGSPDAGAFQFGAPGWIPLAGDWTGNGKFGIGVFDPATATFYLRNELSGGAPDAGVIQFGLTNWKPVVGDWNGDGKWTIGVVDPSGARDTVNHRDAYWFLSNDDKTVSYTPFAYGFAAWTPVGGDWNFPNSTPGAAKNRSGSPILTEDQLQGTVRTALEQLRDANVAVALLDRLGAVQFEVGVLSGGVLSQLDQGGEQVTVDATAARQGWSLEGTASVRVLLGNGDGTFQAPHNYRQSGK